MTAESASSVEVGRHPSGASAWGASQRGAPVPFPAKQDRFCEKENHQNQALERVLVANVFPALAGRTLGDRLAAALEAALARDGVQLVGGLLFAVLLPALVRRSAARLLAIAPPLEPAEISLLGAALALAGGFLAWRKIRRFPGAATSLNAFLAFSIPFALLGLALETSSAPHSRWDLLACGAMAIAWFVFLQSVLGASRPLRLGLVPPLAPADFPSSPLLVLTRLASPHFRPGLDGIVADLSGELSAPWRDLLTRFAVAGVPVLDRRQIGETAEGRVAIERLTEDALAWRDRARLWRAFKRAFDILAVIALGPLVAAVVVAAGLLIRLESSGPVFFIQTRIGLRGRSFRMLKLRTMRHAEEGGERFTEEDDPRVTRIGRVLRKFHIDELPQAWNILIGEMSWIGPRPEAIELAEWYEREIPLYAYRHIVRPGLTGWAQVRQGNVARPQAARTKLHYDFYYLKNLSPWLDLAIALET
ncbi:MAG: sugar transferase, partial [Caulobacteraceae bacterium]